MNPVSAHIHNDDLPLYNRGRLGTIETDILEHHALLCAECTSRLADTARSMAQRMHLSNYGGVDTFDTPVRAADTGFLRSFSPLLPDRWPVEVLKASKSALVLLDPIFLLPSVLVQVQTNETLALGEVVTSKQVAPEQFHTEIQLQDVVKSSA